jgi:transposase-like protein
VGAVLDINPSTLRNWAEREEIDAGVRPGVTTEAFDELKALRREVAELRGRTRSSRPPRRFSPRRSSTADSGSRRLPRRAQDRFGVEPIRRVLTEHGRRSP